MGLRAKPQSAFTRVYFCDVISHIGREQQEIIAMSEQKEKIILTRSPPRSEVNSLLQVNHG